jgi:pilus assembly protein CpaE
VVGTPTRVLVAVDSGLVPADIAQVVPNDAEIVTIGVIDGMDESWRILQDSSVDLVVVACAGQSERALFLVDGAKKQDVRRPVLVLSEGSPNGFVKRAFEAGADDILTLPQTRDQLRFAIQKALARGHGETLKSGVALGRMVCILGPKGGAGKTLTATNVAVALAEVGQTVVIVDLDLQFGDVGLSIGLSPSSTIYDLAVSGGSLDSTKLADFVVEHRSGVRTLLAPSRPDQAATISTPFMREVYGILRLNYDYVIVDTPPGFTPEVISAIDSSTDIVVVGMLDALSLKNTKLGLETIELMGYRDDRIWLVLNRAQSKIGLTSQDVQAVLGRKPDVLVPSDREIPRALSEGVPIVQARPKSEPAGAFKQLAELLIEARAKDEESSDPSFTGGPEPRRRLLKRKA